MLVITFLIHDIGSDVKLYGVWPINNTDNRLSLFETKDWLLGACRLSCAPSIPRPLHQHYPKDNNVPAQYIHDEVHRAPLPGVGGSVAHFDTCVERGVRASL